jgi:hypothetical protein
MGGGFTMEKLTTYEKRQIGNGIGCYQIFCAVCDELFLSDTYRRTCCKSHADILRQINRKDK